MIGPMFDISVVCASGSHVQGIAVDAGREFLYFSFTTCLMKTERSMAPWNSSRMPSAGVF